MPLLHPKKLKQKLTLAALTFTREQWAHLSRQKRKRYANRRNRLRRGEQPLKHPVKKREDDKSTKVNSQSTTVVESDLNRAGEDHPQRPEAVAESVTQTAMEVDEPVTVPVKAMPTPLVILDGGVDSHFHLDRLARRVRGEKFMSKSMALSSVLQEASPKSSLASTSDGGGFIL